MKRIFFVSIIALCTIAFYSCKKEGCTDSDSINYNEDADTDDGSCEYEGSVAFYWDEATAWGLQFWGINTVTLYLDGHDIGSNSLSNYYNNVPDCSADSVISTTKNLGGQKSGNFDFYALDSHLDTIWTGNVDIELNSCISYELE